MEDDSTDWARTRAPFIEKFEEKLRCPICREVLRRAPTMTECGHTFCGECLGRHLNSEKTCPLCRSEVQRAKLRLNKLVEDLADDWALAVRQQLMAKLPQPASMPAATAATAATEGTETANESGPEVIDLSSDAPTPSSETQTSGTQEAAALPEGYSTCPICARALPISEIEGKHIDSCLKSQSASNGASEAPPRKKRAVFGADGGKALEKLTIPFYPGLSELKLRNALKDAQLSTKGSKQRLIARHQEWVNIWNTNIVSKHPRPVSELRRMMAQWDRSQEHSNNANLKELDAAVWTHQNKASFDELVQHARKSRDNQKGGEASN